MLRFSQSLASVAPFVHGTPSDQERWIHVWPTDVQSLGFAAVAFLEGRLHILSILKLIARAANLSPFVLQLIHKGEFVRPILSEFGAAAAEKAQS